MASLAALALAGGCGSSGGDPRAAADQWVAAWAENDDDKFCDVLSSAAKAATSDCRMSLPCHFISKAKCERVKRGWSRAKVSALSVSGDSGEFLITIPGAGPRSYRLVKEDGRWKVDDR